MGMENTQRLFGGTLLAVFVAALHNHNDHLYNFTLCEIIHHARCIRHGYQRESDSTQRYD